MSDKKLNSHMDSYNVDSTTNLVSRDDLVDHTLGLKEVNGSFRGANLSGSIEVLTTTDSRTSDLLDNSSQPFGSSTDTFVDSPSNEFLVIDDSEFLVSKDGKDPLLNEEYKGYSTTETYRDEKENSLLTSVFGPEFSFKLAFFMVVFVLTNTAQPLLIMLLRKSGGTPNGTYTFLLPTYFAMVCVGVYPTKKTIFQENWKYPILLAFLDVLHQVIEKAGLIYCGPSIYSIASSTNTMFLALFSKLILKQTVTSLTWLSISLISFSLGLSGYAQIDHITTLHVFGFFLVMLASMVSALNSTIGEVILKKDRIEGPNLVCMMGLTSLTIFSVWSMVWTYPQRHTLFATDKDLNPFDLKSVLYILLVLLVSNFGRSSVYYYIIKKCGSVSCGVLKALRIVLIVLGDHYLFSYIDGGQKLTPGKVVASLICTAGVIFYSLERSGWSFKSKSE